MDVIVTEHARFEIQRRGIKETNVITAINKPQQRIPSLKGRMILQNKYFDKTEGKDMLLRVIGKESPKGFVLITAYKTSKIEKYWMKEEL